MTDRPSRPRGAPTIRVVSHHPWRRALLLIAVGLLVVGGSLGGYWFGRSLSGLDGSYLDSVERLNQANRQSLEALEAELVDANLSWQVDREAAQTLKETIRDLKDQVAKLTEEVTFYKSLMAPSTLERGIQVADFELTPLEQAGRYRFHLLLTQVETRRDWVQGDVSLVVRGRAEADDPESTAGSDSATGTTERVLPLTEIAEEGTYPLKFRFRYFQDLTGVIRLPAGFTPEQIVITAGRRGASTEAANRTFDWTVAG